MVRSTAFASLAILASFAVAAHAETGNVVGGGGAMITGGSDDMRISYNTSGAGGGGVVVQSGRLARFAGSHGDGQLVEYLTPAPAGMGRNVRLIGGGDDAQLVADQNR